MVEEEDEELEHEEANDAYASYFTKSYVPKILITCSDNPHTVKVHSDCIAWLVRN